MYFSDLIAVLRRRWRIFLAGFLLAGLASAGVLMYVPAQYQASGNVLFLLPAKTATGPMNPYLNLQSGLNVAASLVGGVVTTLGTQQEVVASGFTSQYAVAQSPDGVPLLSVSAEDTDPDMAVKTVAEVIRHIDFQLNQMQVDAGAPTGQFMTIKEFSVTPTAQVVSGSKTRALGVALAVIVLGTALVAFSVDGSRHRKDSRLRSAAEHEPSEGIAPGAGLRDRGRAWRRKASRRRPGPRRLPRSRRSSNDHVARALPVASVAKPSTDPEETPNHPPDDLDRAAGVRRYQRSV